MAIILFTIAIISAGMIGTISILLAGLIILFALLYDKYAKPHAFWGPVIMGCCRGLNLLLGISIIGYYLWPIAYIAVVPVIYIFAVTRISRGEVHGGNKKHLRFSLILYLLVMIAIIIIAFIYHHFLITMAGIILFAWMILPSLIKAIRRPEAAFIGKSVKAGVLGVILLDVCWSLVSENIWLAIIICTLLPVSLLFAKMFAVT